MKRPLVLSLCTSLVVGCAAGVSPPPGAQAPEPTRQLGSPFADPRGAGTSFPLVLDPEDFRLGTTVQFDRVPGPDELHDATAYLGLRRVVVSLEAWPTGYEAVRPLEQVPQGADLVVVLRGWPPSRAAVEAWNLLQVRQRIVLLVDGPPPDLGVANDLNALRGLERVIATMEQPSRSGFERIQRPISFRVLKE